MNSREELIYQALLVVALQQKVSLEEIRTEIQAAINQGFFNRDPVIQAMWQEVRHAGIVPTPEEYMQHLLYDNGGAIEKADCLKMN